MDDQERNHEALIDRIAAQDRLIRRRNEQIAQQAENSREAQNAIEDIEAELEGYRKMHSQQIKAIARRNDRIAEVKARADELARELAHAVTRAEKAEMESGRAAEAAERWRESYDALVSLRRPDPPRPLTAADIEQLVTQNRYRVADAIRALYPEEPMATDVLAHTVMTALTEPQRPEGAEKVEAVLNQYWSGDINGDDLADRIVEEMNR